MDIGADRCGHALADIQTFWISEFGKGLFHFCCGVTINGDDYLFDGATYRRMEPFQWRSLLTSRQEFKFGFESPTRKKELFESWSFRKGYQMLLYYRTK